ncbi:MFS transporter [Lentzea jiangxiensis]|uniref:MFS transporter, DHA2 family, methylenomycin A resistance protein n=1 Tax=Lentzea jiangxiensis TaxID=641025 RepID=A0A1H0X5M9_9PSEU|nr:MFS transporter [Lentzea jiangxiensis]SDP98243.1 MFS transporter, DHA2 family, methylenomycin A resistance protein [Lentzea jiangxiensis]
MSVDQLVAGRRGLRLAFVCLGLFMVYLDTTIVNVALPQMQRDLDVGVSGLQWVFDSYVLTFACFLLTSGRLGDVLGRHRVFLAGLVGFTVSSAACALSENITALLVSRFVQGAFGSVMITTSLALVHSMYQSPKERARAVSIWAGVGGLALAAGPVLGGVLVEHNNWPSIFWLNIPIGVVSVLALLMLRAEPESTERQHLDLLGQALFAAAVAALTYGMIEASTAGWTAGYVLASFAGAVVAALLFVWREATCEQPMLPLTFFRNRVVVFSCAINFLVFYGLFGAMFLLTLYLQSVNGLSAVDTGIRFLALSLTIAVGSLIAPRLAHLAGDAYPWVSAFGGLLAGLGLIGLLRLEVGSGFDTYWWSLVLLGLGISFAMAPATIAVLASVEPERVGVAAGVSQTFRQVGGVLGVAMSGTLALRHVKDGVPDALAGLPLPPAALEKLAEAIGSGRFAAADHLPEQLRAAVTNNVAPLLVDGMAVSYTLGAAVALAGVLTPIVLIGRNKKTGLRK